MAASARSEWPASTSGGPFRITGLNDLQPHIDIPSRGIGVGAHLMRLGDKRFRVGAGKARQGDIECDVEAKTALGARADADGGGDRGVGRHFWAALG